MTDCGICCETYNRSNHKIVECPFCDFNACRTCTQTYLVSSVNDPHCMGCKKQWNREFIDQSCTKSFRNKELKQHREQILLDREKCLLPATQELVLREKQQRETVKLLRQCKEELARQRTLQTELENQLYRLRNGYTLPSEGSSQKKTFVRKCPISECKGFLSSAWKCGICESNICSKCNEPNGDDHECDPNNVETVKLLNKDTKPCPSCGTMIFKISGCSQMWCPDCHTAFNWSSGRIETGVIHNPHFYEFQRRGGGGGRNLGDIPCGGMPMLSEMIQFFHPERYQQRHHNNWYYRPTKLAMSSPHEEKLLNIHRNVIHAQNIEIPQYRWREPDNSDLRVSYLMDELSEDAWKSTLQQREKAREKLRDVTNVLTMYCNISGDLFRQMIVKELSQPDCLKNLEELVDYFNTAMKTIHKRYGCVTPYISDEMVMFHFSHKG